MTWKLAVLVSAMLALAGAAHDAGAVARPSLQQLEAMALERADADESALSIFDALAGGPESGKTRKASLQQLFRDPAFRKDLEEWLATFSQDGDPLVHWQQRYRTVIGAAARHLSDQEVDFLFGRFLAPLADVDIARCVRLSNGTAPVRERAAALRLSAADLERLFRTLNRIYLVAVGNAVPEPPPTQKAFGSAMLTLLARMPEDQREQFIRLDERSGDLNEEDVCQLWKLIVPPMRDLGGEPGRLLRRGLIMKMFEPDPRGGGAPSATVSVKGASSAQFEPGEVPLEYPVHAARAGIEGRMTVRIWVDESGRAARVLTVERHFNKPAAVLEDGTELGVAELFDPVVAVFYRSGRFMRKFKDGKPWAYVVDVPLNWKLD